MLLPICGLKKANFPTDRFIVSVSYYFQLAKFWFIKWKFTFGKLTICENANCNFMFACKYFIAILCICNQIWTKELPALTLLSKHSSNMKRSPSFTISSSSSRHGTLDTAYRHKTTKDWASKADKISTTGDKTILASLDSQHVSMFLLLQRFRV